MLSKISLGLAALSVVSAAGASTQLIGCTTKAQIESLGATGTSGTAADLAGCAVSHPTTSSDRTPSLSLAHAQQRGLDEGYGWTIGRYRIADETGRMQDRKQVVLVLLGQR